MSGDVIIPKRDATRPAGVFDWDAPDLQAAARAVMEARVRWGWTFGRRPAVMAIDQIMAAAALQAASEVGAGQ